MTMIKPKLVVKNYLDQNGCPAGGEYESIGLFIRWQKGPIKHPGEEIVPPNGAFVETVIEAATERVQFFQSIERFRCEENDEVLFHLKAAQAALAKRQQRRREQGLEGTHKPDSR